jgi:hypothetical protein
MKLLFIWSPHYGSGSWWHNQEKRGLIMSQPSHLHEMLVGNIVTIGHHARAVFSIYSLERKINNTKSKKELNGLGNNFIHDKVHLTLYRGTHG